MTATLQLRSIRGDDWRNGLALVRQHKWERDMPSCVANGDTWEIYHATDGWRWRRTARNGQIVGSSSEAYVNQRDCIANAKRNGMSCEPV
jgi:uncharacterized protein YegP (UPF0339 family)